MSTPEPELGQMVSVRIRMYEDAPVRHVLVRTCPNGAENFIHAERIRTEHGLAWYEASFKVTEPRMHYQFYIACDDVIYYCTQKGITTYIPDHTYNFVLPADYRQPSWVKSWC